MSDPISPDHYRDTPPNSGLRGECIDYAEQLGFVLGNAFKYVWRAGRKGDMREDLQKAEWYLRRAIETGGFRGRAHLIVDGAVPQTPRRRTLHLIASSTSHGAREAIRLIEHALVNEAALETIDGSHKEHSA